MNAQRVSPAAAPATGTQQTAEEYSVDPPPPGAGMPQAMPPTNRVIYVTLGQPTAHIQTFQFPAPVNTQPSTSTPGVAPPIQQVYVVQSQPSTSAHWALSAISTCLCCPFGLIALFMSWRASREYDNGNIFNGNMYANIAIRLSVCIIAFVLAWNLTGFTFYLFRYFN